MSEGPCRGSSAEQLTCNTWARFLACGLEKTVQPNIWHWEACLSGHIIFITLRDFIPLNVLYLSIDSFGIWNWTNIVGSHLSQKWHQVWVQHTCGIIRFCYIWPRHPGDVHNALFKNTHTILNSFYSPCLLSKTLLHWSNLLKQVMWENTCQWSTTLASFWKHPVNLKIHHDWVSP